MGMKHITDQIFKMRVLDYSGEYGILVKLGIPVVITQLGIIVVSFADTMMVGAYDTKALASAAFVNSIFLVAIVMQLGFAAGLTPLVGALFSQNDSQGVGKMLRAGVIANIGVSVFFTVVLGGLWFFLDTLGQPAELMPLVRPYYLTILASLIPMAVFNAFQQTSNGCTDTATPMWLIIGSNIINIFGNYIMIFGNWGCPELGLTGAGLSTLIARILAMVAMILIYLTSKKRCPVIQGWKQSRCMRDILRKVWVTSYPVAIQSGVECFLWTFGAIVSGWFGTIELAAYQVVNTIAQLGFMIYMGFCVATSIRIANLTGLEDYIGIRHTAMAGLHISLLLSTIASLAFILVFRPLLHLFTPDEVVIGTALPLLLPLVLYQYGDAIQLTYANAIRGTGEVRPLLWASLISYVAVGVPTVYLLAEIFGFGVTGVYYSFSVALFLAATLYFVSFYRNLRRLR